MLQPSQVITGNARQVEKLKQQRYEKQLGFQRQYESLLVEAKERIRQDKSAVMEENIRSEIRNWIDTYFQQTGKIPDLPSAESGGSRMIFSRQVTRNFQIDWNLDLILLFKHIPLSLFYCRDIGLFLCRREPKVP